MTTRSQMDAELQELYDQIPKIPGCDGRCWTSCGPIDMSDRERQKIRQAGYKITPYRQAMQHPETYYCEALTADRRCAVYEMRPVVCRLWGAAEGLPLRLRMLGRKAATSRRRRGLLADLGVQAHRRRRDGASADAGRDQRHHGARAHPRRA